MPSQHADGQSLRRFDKRIQGRQLAGIFKRFGRAAFGIHCTCKTPVDTGRKRRQSGPFRIDPSIDLLSLRYDIGEEYAIVDRSGRREVAALRTSSIALKF